jgi:hypothetical protein
MDVDSPREPDGMTSRLCGRCKELTTYEGLIRVCRHKVFTYLKVRELVQNTSDVPSCPICVMILGAMERCNGPYDPEIWRQTPNSYVDLRASPDLSSGLEIVTGNTYYERIHLIADEGTVYTYVCNATFVHRLLDCLCR